MKKIFTFLFSMSLAACTFAQSGRHQQDQNSGNNYQSTQNTRNSQMNNNGYTNSNSYNRDEHFDQRSNDNGYAYDHADRRNNDGFRNDHDRYERGGDFHDRDHGYRDDRYARQYTQVKVERNYYPQPRFPLLQIILGIGRR